MPQGLGRVTAMNGRSQCPEVDRHEADVSLPREKHTDVLHGRAAEKD